MSREKARFLLAVRLSITSFIILISCDVSSAFWFKELEPAPPLKIDSPQSSLGRESGPPVVSQRIRTGGAASNPQLTPRSQSSSASPATAAETPSVDGSTTFAARVRNFLSGASEQTIGQESAEGGRSWYAPSKEDLDKTLGELLCPEDSPNSRPGPHWKMDR